MNTRMPRGFKTGRDGDVSCNHRSKSCCEECAAKYPELVDVFGAHFWIADPAERAAFMAEEE